MHRLLVTTAALLALLITSFSVQSVYAQGGSTYYVQSGDTLYSIAAMHGVNVNELASVNGLTGSGYIHPGQPLIVPTGPAQFGNQVGYQPAGYVKPIPVNAQPYGNPTNNPYPVAPRVPANPYQPNLNQPILNQPFQPVGFRQPLNQPMNRAPGFHRGPDPTQLSYSLPLPAGPDGPYNMAHGMNGEKWIDIDLTRQIVTAYEGRTPVFRVLVSTGTHLFPTIVGTFKVYAKHDVADMSGGSGEYYYHQPDVPHIMYFHEGYAIHGTYWHHNFGRPMSHGCVNLSQPDGQWLYNWASVGTKVVSRY